MKNFNAITILSLVFLGLGLTACETMEGAGRDIQKAGAEIEEEAAE